MPQSQKRILHTNDEDTRQLNRKAIRATKKNYWDITEVRFQKLFIQSSLGVCITDIHNRFLAVNDMLEKMWGYSKEELMSMSFTDVTHPEDIQKNLDLIQKVIDGELSTFNIEKRYLSKAGQTIWGRVTVSAIHDERGTISSLISIVENIDQWKKTEFALENERLLLQTLMDSTFDSVYFKDLENRFIRVNKGTLDKFGLKSPEEIIGKTDFDFFPEEIARANYDEELEIIRTGKPVIAVEGMEVWKDRTPTWVSSTKIPVRDSDGNVIGTFGISRDITSLKQKEEEISQANTYLEKRIAEHTQELLHKNKELEAFTYTVSHDLKAPLRGISGYSALLLQEHSSQLDEEGRSFLNKLIFSADQLRNLIDDLLAYSRLERCEISLSPVSITNIIHVVLEQFNREIEERKVIVHLDLEESTIYSNPELLTQILQNYLENALKFTTKCEQPEIWIQYHTVGETRLFSIRDNGIGFDNSYSEKIFEVFQRLNRTEEFDGTGIGLALVKKAADKLGYRVWAEGKPGQGAIFYLEI